MTYTVLGQQYDEQELQQLLAIRDLFEKTSVRLRRTGVRSEQTQLPKDALAGALEENKRQGFIQKLEVSALIEDGFSHSAFFFNDQRFSEALQKAEEIVEQLERERRQLEQGKAERQEQKIIEQGKLAAEERGRSRQWTYYRVMMVLGVAGLLITLFTFLGLSGYLTPGSGETDPSVEEKQTEPEETKHPTNDAPAGETTHDASSDSDSEASNSNTEKTESDQQ